MPPPPAAPVPPTPADATLDAAGAQQASGESTGGTLASAVRAVSGVTFLSRIGGLVRDVVIGRAFGVTAVGSAFLFAFAIPNMFRRLFGEGALSAAFIPEYTDAAKSDPARAGALASLTLTGLGVATAAITAIAELVLLALLIFLPHDPDRVLTLRLTMVMLPFMPFICAAAILAAMLQVHGRFGASSTGPLILNGFIIIVGGYFMLTGQLAGAPVAYAMAIATVLSGLTQSIWFARLLRPHVRWSRDWSGLRPHAVRMFRRFVPVMIGLGTLQVAALLDSVIATWPILVGPTLLGHAYPLDAGSNTVLVLTQRLYQFPLGVFGIAVATAVFPLLARTKDDGAAFADTLRRGLRLSLFIGLPASAGLALVRTDAVAVLYSGGATGFEPADIARSGAVLLGYAVGVWAYSVNHVFTRAFYARGDTATPMRVALASVVLNLGLNLTLIWFLAEAGLAWATSIAATAQCVALATLCRARLGVSPVDASTLAAAARILAATLAMAAGVAGVLLLLPSANTWGDHALRLAGGTGVGGALYLLLARLGRLAELRWLLRRRA